MQHYLKIISLITMPLFLHGIDESKKTYLQDPAPMKTVNVSTNHWETIKNKLEKKTFKFAKITIPKSGTHLLHKCIALLSGKKPNDIEKKSKESTPRECKKTTREIFINACKRDFIQKILAIQDPSTFSHHLIYTAEYKDFIERYAPTTLFLIRDPRDQLLSFTNWTCEQSKKGTVDFDNMILDFIDGKQRYKHCAVKMGTAADFIWTLGITEFYKLFLPWTSARNVYTVRFENLVGSKGGGSDELQIQEIRNIARHLKIPLTDKKLNSVTTNLFGGTGTFVKGQIGSWKKSFTPEHKAAFKRVAGQLLIDLGYEKDLNW